MNKKLLCAISAAALLASAVPAAYAADVPAQRPSAETMASETEISPRADIIEYKFRLLDGKQQYRRWNRTRGYWVDPEWIDLDV